MAFFSDGKEQIAGIEQGTFMPTLQDSSGLDTEGQTYSLQQGFFTKIGSLVMFNFHLIVTSLGTLTVTQVADIAGFPFPIVGDAGGGMLIQGTSLNLEGTDDPITIVFGMAGSEQKGRIMMLNQIGGHASVFISQLSVGADMKFTGSYRTDA